MNAHTVHKGAVCTMCLHCGQYEKQYCTGRKKVFSDAKHTVERDQLCKRQALKLNLHVAMVKKVR